MRFNIDSIAIDYQRHTDNRRPFVFVHGNTQNDSCGRGVKAYFFAKGHSVLSYDLPGHGDSPLTGNDYQFSDLVELNYQILQHYPLANPILCGHSLGGMIQAATIARYQLKPSSLILCGSYDQNPIEAAKQQSRPEAAAAIDAMLEHYIAEGFDLFQQQKKYDYFANRSIDDETANTFNRLYTQPLANQTNLQTLRDFDVRRQLVELAIPILVLHGKEETVIPPPLIELMVAAYQQIRLGWYPDSGHYAFYQQPELTKRHLDAYYRFLNG
jgi:pimeloyl-ACP methyl ester carboxylesterase